MILLLLACVRAVPHVAYDPLGGAPVVPLVGGELLVVGTPGRFTVRNAADHVVWVNEVDVVPAGAARLGRPRFPVEVPPDGTWALDVTPLAPGQLVIRTSEGVRFVALRAGPGGPAPTTGTRDRAAIAAVVADHLPTLSRCYEDDLARHRDLRGRVRLKFAIDPDGAVSSVGFLDSTLAAGDVESCLAAALRRVEFGAEPGSGVVVVAYPFVFEPAG